MSNRKNWKPLEPATVTGPQAGPGYERPEMRVFVEEAMRKLNCTREEAIAAMNAEDAHLTWYINDIYQVQVREFFCEEFNQPMVHLNIRRRDGAAVFDWRHRQWIKNQLVGEECEAFEVYPAESRLSDTSNKYHLFCFKDPTVRLPVRVSIYDDRDVIEHEVKSPPGARQRRM